MAEVAVGIGLFAVVSVAMAGLVAGGLRGVLLGKQRAAATAAANELLETARSLAFADLGLVSDDATLDADPAIVTASPTDRRFGGEPIVFSQRTTGHPFKPHVQQLVRSPTRLTRWVYVTGVDTTGDGVPDLKRVTVRVSWERSGVAGVSNQVTASTLVAPNSPGTPGNPPLGNVGPGGTPAPPPFPPLRGTALARAPDAVLEADVGAGSALDGSSPRSPAVLRLFGVNGAGTNVLDASTKVTCSQQVARLEGSRGSVSASTSGTTASNSADSVSDPGPKTTSRSQFESLSGVSPLPIAVGTLALQGGVSCTSSAVTSAPLLPFEQGTGTFAGLTASVDTSSAPLRASFGTLNLLEVVGLQAGQGTAQSDPADKRITASASHGLQDLKVMRQAGIGVGTIDIGAPEGLVHVLAYAATATAQASSGTGSTAVTVDPSRPLEVRVWDGGNPLNLTDQAGGPVVCDGRTGNYCVLRPQVGTGRIVQLDRTFCLGLSGLLCLVELHVQVTVTVNPASARATTLPDGITRLYRVDYTPVTVVARVWANDVGSTSPGFDLRTTVDAGRLVACAKYGVYPGGC